MSCFAARTPSTTDNTGEILSSASNSEKVSRRGSGQTRRNVARQDAACCEVSSANSDVPRKAAASSAISSNFPQSSSLAERQAQLRKSLRFVLSRNRDLLPANQQDFCDHECGPLLPPIRYRENSYRSRWGMQAKANSAVSRELAVRFHAVDHS